MSGLISNPHFDPSQRLISKSHSEAMLVKACKNQLPRLQNATPVSLKNGNSTEAFGASLDRSKNKCHHKHKNGCLSTTRLRGHHHHHHHHHNNKQASAGVEILESNAQVPSISKTEHSISRATMVVIPTQGQDQGDQIF